LLAGGGEALGAAALCNSACGVHIPSDEKEESLIEGQGTCRVVSVSVQIASGARARCVSGGGVPAVRLCGECVQGADERLHPPPKRNLRKYLSSEIFIKRQSLVRPRARTPASANAEVRRARACVFLKSRRVRAVSVVLHSVPPPQVCRGNATCGVCAFCIQCCAGHCPARAGLALREWPSSGR
jgi:hypothetical protein